MKHLLGKEDIVVEETPFHKATLVRGDNQREEGGDSRCKDFGNDFVDDVAKTNGAIISPSLWEGFLWDEDNACRRDATR